MNNIFELAKNWNTIKDEEVLAFKTWFKEQINCPGEAADIRLACTNSWHLGKVIDVCVQKPIIKHFLLLKDEETVKVLYSGGYRCPFGRC